MPKLQEGITGEETAGDLPSGNTMSVIKKNNHAITSRAYDMHASLPQYANQ